MTSSVQSAATPAPGWVRPVGARERRSAAKRAAVISAATDLFLTVGYAGTTMERVADRAAVSKPTVYRFFADKEALFAQVVFDTLDRFGRPFRASLEKLGSSTHVERDLTRAARDYIALVTEPSIIGLRRLVIGASAQLPHIASAYYERAPEHTLRALAAALDQLDTRGVLRVRDPHLAAAHFAMLVIGQALDKSLFRPDDTLTEAQSRAHARTGVAVFLQAYGPDRG